MTSSELLDAELSSFQIQERIAIDDVAIYDEAGDPAGIPDALCGVAVDDEDVGAAAGGDLAQLIPAKLKE